MSERKVVIVDGARTGFAKMGGSMRDICGVDIGVLAAAGLVKKAGIIERGVTVDSLFAGSSLADILCVDPARYISRGCGLPVETSASYVEMQCGSAIDAINHAAWKILCGAADVVIAGGFETYSQAFAKFPTSVAPYKMTPPTAVVQKLSPIEEENITMLEISDLMAARWGISREECDEFALRSQRLAASSQEKGYFREEIVPVTIKGGKKKPDVVFDTDEHIRPGTTLEALSALRSVLPGGVTTAGNSSGRNDGAAFVLLMTEEKAREYGYTPYARWVAGADAGVDPRYMGIGPVFSNLKALRLAGLGIDDIGVLECNEAFAAQNLSVIRELEAQTGARIDMDRWNPNGGAIAFGHPNGASGARLCIFTVKELERRGAKYGLFSSCCGGGQGVSTLIENLRR